MVTPYEGYVEVCEALGRAHPRRSREEVRAVQLPAPKPSKNAVKIARAAHRAPGRPSCSTTPITARTNLTMGMTAKSVPYKHGFGPFPPPRSTRVPGSYPYRDGLSRRGSRRASRSTGSRSRSAAARVAAVVLEADPGRGRLHRAPRAASCPRFSRLGARKNGVVPRRRRGADRLLPDRRVVRLDRRETSVPDLIATAKGIAGGLPLAAVTGRAELLDAVGPGGLGGTYGGNPIACAAALGSIETMRNEEPRRIGQARRERRAAAAAARPGRGDRRDRRRPRAAARCWPPSSSSRARPNPTPSSPSASRRRATGPGVVVLTCGTYGNVVRLLPPLSLSNDLLDEGLSVLEHAVPHGGPQVTTPVLGRRENR